MQNKYFIGYAKESFDGTPLSYGVDFCDEAPEDHIVDVSDPNLYIDVHITGRLDDEIALAQLAEFLREHNLSANCLNQSREQTFASEESINAAFEDTASATEAGFKDAVKNLFAKQALARSEKLVGNLRPYWDANLRNLTECTTTGVFKQTALTAIQAARFFAASYTEGVDKMYVCYQTNLKKGQSEHKVAEIEQKIEATDPGTDKEEKKVIVMVKDIRSKTTEKEIVGYTFDKAQADKWENSLSDAPIKDGDEAADVDEDGEVKTTNNSSLDEMWKQAKTVRERLVLLQRYLKGIDGFDSSKVAQDVLIGLAGRTNFKETWIWKALSYVVENEQGFDAGVFKAIDASKTMQLELFGGPDGIRIDGLDFGKQTQFAVIRAALGTEYMEQLYDKGTKKWMDASSMAALYKSKNKFEDARTTTARQRQADRNNFSPETLAQQMSSLTPEQINELVTAIARENPDRAADILQAFMGKK